ncbi:AfsR/SARP family transcriptional regulator [Amycolatopsis palatopharyngis]|uniref:AfsR/SARP family transcriptional regulator n=1 Tax=Amycolatopsis palatopharyngis TaxID=187982 RepID=UPI000E2710E4|nr:AfsR/SARP family transcriptional regulator [Amycolatopsis palatopharyngis]
MRITSGDASTNSWGLPGGLDDTSSRAAPKPPEHVVSFSILGPVEVLKNGIDYAPTTPKILQLLAMLIARPGKIVHIDSIINELWEDGPPRSVRTTVHTYVYHLRRFIEQNGLAADAESMLVTRAPGYVLRIDPAQVDVFTFQRLHRQGRELLDRGEHARAANCFRSALDLWSGPPVANVQCGPVLSAYGVELLEQRRNAHYLRIEADINGGLHRELVGELRSLVAANPLDERMHGQLLRVLAHSGRRSDAMASYRQLRERLNEDLGVEPCDELQVLHRALLSEGDPRS